MSTPQPGQASAEPTVDTAAPDPHPEASTPDTSVDTPATAEPTVDEEATTADAAASGTDTTLAEAAAADAATDLARTDPANTTVATMSGVILTVLLAGAGITSGDGSYPIAALVAMGVAAASLSIVLVVFAVAMWPQRRGTGGVPHYATLSPAELATELATADPALWHAERAVVKARIAARKHVAQRLAGVGLAAAGLLLAVATILTLALR